MESRRGFMKTLAAGSSLGLADTYIDQVSNAETEDSDVFDHVKDVMSEIGEINGEIHKTTDMIHKNQMNKDKDTAYIIGIEGPDQDLYATSLADSDKTFLEKNKCLFEDIAEKISEAGQKLEGEDELPYGNDLEVFAGVTGRNNSFMPVRIHFSPFTTFDPEEKVQYVFEEIRDQTCNTRNGLIPNQTRALELLDGFDDEYREKNRLAVVEDIDGIKDNDRKDTGEFELDGNYAELVDTYSEGEPMAEIRLDPDGEARHASVGENFEVGDYTLEVTHIDSESGYIETEVMEGDYESIENTPFPQVDEPSDLFS